MLESFRWLVQDARPGDSLFLHYSGHGGSQADETGDEADGSDETLCPVDYAAEGVIIDDVFTSILTSGSTQVPR